HTMACLHQSCEFQTGNRFSHHVTAYTELCSQRLLGRQTLPGAQGFIQNPVTQLLGNLIGQIFRTTKTFECRNGLAHSLATCLAAVNCSSKTIHHANPRCSDVVCCVITVVPSVIL